MKTDATPASETAGRRHRDGRVRAGLTAAAIVLLLGVVMHAASLSRTATATATVTALAKLTLSSTTLAFPDADPDSVPNVSASGGPLTITAKARTTIGSTVTLAVVATNDLQVRPRCDPCHPDALDFDRDRYIAGTMSKTSAQVVGSWVSSGAWTGTQSYTLANSWTYATGTYSTTLTYTLTAP